MKETGKSWEKDCLEGGAFEGWWLSVLMRMPVCMSRRDSGIFPFGKQPGC